MNKEEFIELFNGNDGVSVTLAVGGILISGIEATSPADAYDLGDSVEIKCCNFTAFEIADEWFENCVIDRTQEESDGIREAHLNCGKGDLYITIFKHK